MSFGGWIKAFVERLSSDRVPNASSDTAGRASAPPGPSFQTGPTNAADPAVRAAMQEVAEPYADEAEYETDEWAGEGPAAQPQLVDEQHARDEGLRVDSARSGQRQGRENRVAWLSTLEFDPKVPAHIRGRLKHERQRVEQGRRRTPRTPPGMVMAHGRQTPAREGYDYSNSRPSGVDLNQLEEKVRRRDPKKADE